MLSTPKGAIHADPREDVHFGGSFVELNIDHPTRPPSDSPTATLIWDQRRLYAFIFNAQHLQLLPSVALDEIASDMLCREYDDGEVVVAPGASPRNALVLLAGVIAISDCEGRRVALLEPGSFFACENVMLNVPHDMTYTSIQMRTAVGVISAKQLRRACTHIPFRRSLSIRIAEHFGIFDCFKEFCRCVFSPTANRHEYLPIWSILDAYININNSIHSKMLTTEIDVAAWSYALRRLPQNVTTTFCFDLVRALPAFLATRMRRATSRRDDYATGLKFVNTTDRRRCTWQLGLQGKTLVLLRDGFTDLMDFLTMMCVHIIEANKLRSKLQGMVSPPAIDMIDEALQRGATDSETRDVLSRMPLSKEERDGLYQCWGQDTLTRMYEVIMHREEYLFRLDASISRRFQIDPFHEWALNLRSIVMANMGFNATHPIPETLRVDIISSNTHSTNSLLSPFVRDHRERILQYLAERRPELNLSQWLFEDDAIYANLRYYVNDMHLQQEYNTALESCNIKVMDDTAMTGLVVDVIPVSSLKFSSIDTILSRYNCQSKSQHHFILNMDFAFGAQADGVTKALVDTFGPYIRSFNVMGKAGGLGPSEHRRGDIQIASGLLFSKSSLTMEDVLDELYMFDTVVDGSLVRDIAGPRVGIHRGEVLTIPGTLMQNALLMRYYREMWNCVGVEMEGSYFARRLRESMKAELLSTDVRARFLYYTSDLPLAPAEESLAAPLQQHEGVPPVYAVSRVILAHIIGNADDSHRSS